MNCRYSSIFFDEPTGLEKERLAEPVMCFPSLTKSTRRIIFKAIIYEGLEELVDLTPEDIKQISEEIMRTSKNNDNLLKYNKDLLRELIHLDKAIRKSRELYCEYRQKEKSKKA